MIRTSYTISFVLVVCCIFKHNAAIPLAPHSAVTNQMQNIFKENTDSQNKWNDTILPSYATRERELSDMNFNGHRVTKPHNLNYRGPQKKKPMNNNQNPKMNRNVNVNVNDPPHHERYKQGKTVGSILTAIHNLEDIIKKEQPVNCTVDKKNHQRYSSSFLGNSTNLNVDKEFEQVVGNNSRTRKSSSIHEGEDITLCWIETMTIKDDSTVHPPKRLVIREYTISFENSATIPDRYVECKRLEGELAVNDPEIGKTALFEIIDENTKVSKVVNFTSVGHIGDITVWQHKRVKCGVGPVVSKNIIEWKDDSDNPKKRVEIKISPKMHKLTTKNEEEEPCTESSEEKIEQSSTSTDITSHVTDEITCENTQNGICEMITESNGISTSSLESTTEKAVTESSTSESNESQSEEEFSLPVSITIPSFGEKETESFTEPSVTTTERPFTIPVRSDESLSSKENYSNCEDPLDPACAVRDITMSLWELSTELSATIETTVQAEILSTDTATTSTPSQKAITQEITVEKFSGDKAPLLTTESLESTEDETSKVISDLMETVTFAPTAKVEYDSVLMKTSESTSQPIVDTTTTTTTKSLDYDYGIAVTIESKESNTTSPSIIRDKKMKESNEDVSSSISMELEDYDMMLPPGSTGNQSDKTDYVPSLDNNTVISSEIDTKLDTTTAIQSIEFSRKPEKSDKISHRSSTSNVPTVTTESMSTETTKSLSVEDTTTESLSNEITAILLTSKGTSSYSLSDSEENLTREIKKTMTIRPRIPVEEFISMTSTTTLKIPEIASTTVSPTTSGFDYMCENSEDCLYSNSEVCDESGNCSNTNESCESGSCSEEQNVESKSDLTSPSTIQKIQTSLIDLQSSEVPTTIEAQQQHTSTTATILISEEDDKISMAIDNVPTTVETRRSTPLSSITTVRPKHKLILKIKVLLEHVNEKREKENLVEIEKQLSLDEDLDHKRPDLLKQLKSFNDSINMETISTLLNCTSLGNLTKNLNLISKQPSHNINSESEELQYTYSTDPISELSSEQIKYESQYPEVDKLIEFQKRKRRDFADLFNPTNINANSVKDGMRSGNKFEEQASNTAYGNEKDKLTTTKSDIEKAKMEIVRQVLPDVVKDFSVGLQDVMSQLTRHNLTLTNEPKTVAKTDLLDIIADPKDNRFHSRRRRAATEEVGRWSNERITKVPMGGNLRSFTEFILYDILS